MASITKKNKKLLTRNYKKNKHTKNKRKNVKKFFSKKKNFRRKISRKKTKRKRKGKQKQRAGMFGALQRAFSPDITNQPVTLEKLESERKRFEKVLKRSEEDHIKKMQENIDDPTQAKKEGDILAKLLVQKPIYDFFIEYYKQLKDTDKSGNYWYCTFLNYDNKGSVSDRQLRNYMEHHRERFPNHPDPCFKDGHNLHDDNKEIHRYYNENDERLKTWNLLTKEYFPNLVVIPQIKESPPSRSSSVGSPFSPINFASRFFTSTSPTPSPSPSPSPQLIQPKTPYSRQANFYADDGRPM